MQQCTVSARGLEQVSSALLTLCVQCAALALLLAAFSVRWIRPVATVQELQLLGKQTTAAVTLSKAS